MSYQLHNAMSSNSSVDLYISVQLVMKKCKIFAKGRLCDLLLHAYMKCMDHKGDMEDMKLMSTAKYWVRSHPGSKLRKDIHVFSSFSQMFSCRAARPRL